MVDDGRTTDGRTTEHGYTISSPCEPDGSGELIKQIQVGNDQEKKEILTSKTEVGKKMTIRYSYLENIS